MGLSAAQQAYWLSYVDGLAPEQRPDAPRVIAGHAGSPEIADELLGLYLAGAKTAGSGLLADYLTAGDPVPQVGDQWIVLSAAGEPGCIVRTTRVELNRFDQIPAEIAAAEGEGDLSVAYWTRVHAEHFGPHLAAWGIADLGAATVVTEFFELVYAGPAGPLPLR